MLNSPKLPSWRSSMVGGFPGPGWRRWATLHCIWDRDKRKFTWKHISEGISFIINKLFRTTGSLGFIQKTHLANDGTKRVSHHVDTIGPLSLHHWTGSCCFFYFVFFFKGVSLTCPEVRWWPSWFCWMWRRHGFSQSCIRVAPRLKGTDKKTCSQSWPAPVGENLRLYKRHKHTQARTQRESPNSLTLSVLVMTESDKLTTS